MGSEVETPLTDEGEESDIDDRDDEGSQDKQFGWGTAHGRHSVHPGRWLLTNVHDCAKSVSGFLMEDQTSQGTQPRVTSALPSDFEFQYSHDKDDNVAQASLVAGDSSSDDDAAIKV